MLSIVIMDKDPMFLELMEFCLTTHGYRAICCSDLEQVFVVTRDEHVALLLIDTDRASYGGCLELLDRLECDDAVDRCAVIVCSIDRAILQAGAEELAELSAVTLVKPFRVIDLLLIVECQIGRSRTSKGG